jgi:hypothetical protein
LLTVDAGFEVDFLLAFDFPLGASFEIAGDEKEADSVAAKSVSERIPAKNFMRHSSLGGCNKRCRGED